MPRTCHKRSLHGNVHADDATDLHNAKMTSMLRNFLQSSWEKVGHRQFQKEEHEGELQTVKEREGERERERESATTMLAS